jgi:hypothetical protein
MGYTSPIALAAIAHCCFMNYKTVLKRKKKGRDHELRNGFVEEICMVHQTSC